MPMTNLDEPTLGPIEISSTHKDQGYNCSFGPLLTHESLVSNSGTDSSIAHFGDLFSWTNNEHLEGQKLYRLIFRWRGPVIHFDLVPISKKEAFQDSLGVIHLIFLPEFSTKLYIPMSNIVQAFDQIATRSLVKAEKDRLRSSLSILQPITFYKSGTAFVWIKRMQPRPIPVLRNFRAVESNALPDALKVLTRCVCKALIEASSPAPARFTMYTPPSTITRGSTRDKEQVVPSQVPDVQIATAACCPPIELAPHSTLTSPLDFEGTNLASYSGFTPSSFDGSFGTTQYQTTELSIGSGSNSSEPELPPVGFSDYSTASVPSHPIYLPYNPRLHEPTAPHMYTSVASCSSPDYSLQPYFPTPQGPRIAYELGGPEWSFNLRPSMNVPFISSSASDNALPPMDIDQSNSPAYTASSRTRDISLAAFWCSSY